MSHHYHEHDHVQDAETYYLDQLCLIGLSGAFGAVCLSLFFWQGKMLSLMLASQFHNFVLFSGIALLALTFVRAVALWVAVGRSKMTADSEPHEHIPEPEHAHAHHHHEGVDCQHHHGHPSQEAAHCCTNEPAHSHSHQQGTGHSHAHSHGHCQDHDHAWAPWRYVVLLVPIILFLLGLPNKGPKVRANNNVNVAKDMIQEAIGVVTVAASDPASWPQLILAAAFAADPAAGPVTNIDFKTLERAAFDPEQRQRWQGQTVRVRGQYAPHPSNDRVFSLARFSIQCCRADAIQLNVTIISRESLAGVMANQWVEVTGKVEFREHNGSFFTLMLIPGKKAIKPTDPDTNPYV